MQHTPLPDRLDGTALKRMLEAAAAALTREQAAIDALNVFPVPDGDTGSNMALTLRAAAQAAAQAPDQVGEVARAAARGALLGARGNSGVILSQFLAGLSEGLAGLAEAGAADVQRALRHAADRAYRAVAEPAEGTMLTVGRAAAEAAQGECTLAAVLQAAVRGALAAVARTPEQLPVLRAAGVVDAGGRGLAAALEAAVAALAGPAESIPLGVGAALSTNGSGLPLSHDGHPGPEIPLLVWDGQAAPVPGHGPIREEAITFRYCTEFLLSGSHLERERLRQELEPLGDCLLVVGEGDLLRVHLHTNHPGLALEAGLRQGELLSVAVHNMAEQNRQAARAATAAAPPRPQRGVGVVVVSAGAGLADLARSLGADVVVKGGPSRRPSTEEMLKAIQATGCEDCLVLPNDPNVVMTAQMAAELSERRVAVVPTRSEPAGLAALLALDRSASLEENQRRMQERAATVRWGAIARAVRSVEGPQGPVEPGDWVAYVEDQLVASGRDLAALAVQLARALTGNGTAVVSVYVGATVSPDELQVVREALLAGLPDHEVEIYQGGQAVYDFWIAAE